MLQGIKYTGYVISHDSYQGKASLIVYCSKTLKFSLLVKYNILEAEECIWVGGGNADYSGPNQNTSAFEFFPPNIFWGIGPDLPGQQIQKYPLDTDC